MVRFLPTYRFIDLKKTILQTLLSTECLQIFTNRHLPINNDPHTVTDLLHQTKDMGGYNDGLTLFLQIQQEIRHHLRCENIQPIGGLIEIMISGSCTSEITRDTFCFIPVDKSLTRTWANS